MTPFEATEVVAIMLTAHDGCLNCGTRVVRQFTARYPEFESIANDLLKTAAALDKERFDSELRKLKKAARPDWALIDYGFGGPDLPEGENPRREDYPEFNNHHPPRGKPDDTC